MNLFFSIQRSMREELASIKKMVKQQQEAGKKDNIDHALRAAKEYAARSQDLNIDTLQMKLIRLDELARRHDHHDKERISFILQRFLYHKHENKVGLLVATLLSSKTEAAIFEKEQKFFKVHGSGTQMANDSRAQKRAKQEATATSGPPSGGFYPPFPYPSFPHFQPAASGGFSPRPPSSPQRAPRKGRGRCYKCNSDSHYMADCPWNK